jgi:choice-of-anchor B domain-containing protein
MLCVGCLALAASPVRADHPEPAEAFDTEAHIHVETYTGPGWTAGQGGSPSVVFQSSGVELLSWLTVADIDPASNSGSTVEGYVSPSGRQYAVVGVSCGTGFVEVTDPRNAVVRAFVNGPCSLWRDIQIYQDYAYAVSEGGRGIQVMDMSQLDNDMVTLVGEVTAPFVHQVWTHTVHINKASGFLYRCGGQQALGVKVYSLANPASPVWVANVLTTRYVHECQVVTYTSGPNAGKEIAFFYNETSSGGGAASLAIVDVTDKGNPITLANYPYPGARFSHQGWLSEDRNYVYLDDEFDESALGIPMTTHVIDVSNLSAPVQVATFTDGTSCIDHNQYVMGNRLFQSNYRCGLRVWDLANPTAPTQIAWFDTWPVGDGAGYNSLWDNYPFLPNHVVLGSDIEQGLFVWCADPKGDMNHDGFVSESDIQPFVDNLLLESPAVDVCGGGDMNADGLVNGDDFPAFVAKLVGQ